MGQHGEQDKLDWMYKGANSLVNREEYLLGKDIDKPLEQLNKEDKEKKLGIVPPKNHVEHECIPPSIRDFNKIVQAEQVDLSAKLQEDPLIAIKRQEEEARRQFLQNPVQLKKLQEALQAQQIRKKQKKHKKAKHSATESDLDEKLRQKLRNLKNLKGTDILKKQRKNCTEHLDTILMHKFNKLKEKLSQEDLKDILSGKISDSDEDESTQRKQKFSNSEEQEHIGKKIKSDGKKIIHSKDRNRKNREEPVGKERRSKHIEIDEEYNYRNRQHGSSSDSDIELERSKDKRKQKKTYHKEEIRVSEKHSKAPNDDLDKMILMKLRSLRDTQPSEGQKVKTTEETYSYYDSDEDEVVHKKKAFGLVRPDGTKIPLMRQSQETVVESTKKTEPAKNPEMKRPRKLTEAEKEERRNQMMTDAAKRDTERRRNLKRHRQDEEKQEGQKDFDKNFMLKQLARTANEASVESRLKSNLTNLQRSSQYMNSNFSRR